MLVARSRCRLKWFSLANVPAAERRAALRMQAEAWAPFQSSQYQLAVSGNEGLALAWDRADAEAMLAAAGLEPERCILLPETLLRRPDGDGVVLIECVEGVEAQVWRDGMLRASRWWATQPDTQEWMLFLHSVGASVADPSLLRSPQSLPWLDQPWIRMDDAGGGPSGVTGAEGRLVKMLTMAAVFAAAFVGHQLLDNWMLARAKEQAIAAVRETSGQALADRDKAILRATQLQQWAHWFEEPLPIEVISQLHERLAQSSVQIREMDLNGTRLSLGLLLSPNTQRSDIVRRLQGGWFKDVAESRTENSRGLMLIDLTLDGVRAPAKPEPAAKTASGPAASGAPSQPATDPFGGKP